MTYQYKFWKNYFKYYDVLLEVLPYQDLLKKIVQKLEVNRSSKILDLGSGTGNLNLYLPENTDVTCLDNSEAALALLKKKFSAAKTVKHSILEPLPFSDNTFDRVVSNNVLYTLHKSQWTFVVSEIQRVCKPEGIVVISNLNKDFKAVNIYRDHLRKSLKKRGVISALAKAVRLIYPTLQMMRYNSIISKQNQKENYSFIEKSQQKENFKAFGLSSKSPTEVVYSKQAYLDVFINQKN